MQLNRCGKGWVGLVHSIKFPRADTVIEHAGNTTAEPPIIADIKFAYDQEVSHSAASSERLIDTGIIDSGVVQ
jgi:hypothetical protein